VPYFRLDPKALYGGENLLCCGARVSIQSGLSSLVTNEVAMIIEAKVLAKWIAVSSLVGLLALGVCQKHKSCS